VTAVASQMIDMGCYEISLGDTIGVGTPGEFRNLIRILKQAVPVEQLAVHCHDTYGQAVANIFVALEEGITVVDASVAGLGGCPYAKGATGNVATEDVVYMLHALGMNTGVNLEELVKVGYGISDFLDRPYASKAGLAIANKMGLSK
jgi:hydroxymethylglutaryl-CoA lyase